MFKLHFPSCPAHWQLTHRSLVSSAALFVPNALIASYSTLKWGHWAKGPNGLQGSMKLLCTRFISGCPFNIDDYYLKWRLGFNMGNSIHWGCHAHQWHHSYASIWRNICVVSIKKKHNYAKDWRFSWNAILTVSNKHETFMYACLVLWSFPMKTKYCQCQHSKFTSSAYCQHYSNKCKKIFYAKHTFVSTI